MRQLGLPVPSSGRTMSTTLSSTAIHMNIDIGRRRRRRHCAPREEGREATGCIRRQRGGSRESVGVGRDASSSLHVARTRTIRFLQFVKLCPHLLERRADQKSANFIGVAIIQTRHLLITLKLQVVALASLSSSVNLSLESSAIPIFS